MKYSSLIISTFFFMTLGFYTYSYAGNVLIGGEGADIIISSPDDKVVTDGRDLIIQFGNGEKKVLTIDQTVAIVRSREMVRDFSGISTKDMKRDFPGISTYVRNREITRGLAETSVSPEK